MSTAHEQPRVTFKTSADNKFVDEHYIEYLPGVPAVGDRVHAEGFDYVVNMILHVPLARQVIVYMTKLKLNDQV